LAARDPAAPGAQAALETLCAAYWYPVYAYLRRRGTAAPDAQDLTQSFFLHLLDSQMLGRVARERGRFRSFLRASVAHFLVDQWRRDQSQKRGGHVRFAGGDYELAERHYQAHGRAALSPDQLFDRAWALTLLDRVLDRLQAELAALGKGPLFEQLKDRLLDVGNAPSYAELAQRLGDSESNLRKTVSRLRRRYGELLRHEIAHTVASTDDTEEELRQLFAAVSA
jgi:RNA polymerase sigma-70 factor (ECF subfamily)